MAGAQSNHFVIEIIKATDIPQLDNNTTTQTVYIQAYLQSKIDNVYQRVGNTVQTHRRSEYARSSSSVLWHSFRDFGVNPDDAILTVELYALDSTFNRDELVGAVDIMVYKNLKDEDSHTFSFANLMAGQKSSKNPQFSVTLRRAYLYKPPPTYRTFFLIRHGESKWNEAQARINIPGMLLDRDHALTEEGVNQALELNKRWKLANLKDPSLDHAPASMFPDGIDFSRLDDHHRDVLSDDEEEEEDVEVVVASQSIKNQKGRNSQSLSSGGSMKHLDSLNAMHINNYHAKTGGSSTTTSFFSVGKTAHGENNDDDDEAVNSELDKEGAHNNKSNPGSRKHHGNSMEDIGEYFDFSSFSAGTFAAAPEKVGEMDIQNNRAIMEHFNNLSLELTFPDPEGMPASTSPMLKGNALTGSRTSTGNRKSNSNNIKPSDNGFGYASFSDLGVKSLPRGDTHTGAPSSKHISVPNNSGLGNNTSTVHNKNNDNLTNSQDDELPGAGSTSARRSKRQNTSMLLENEYSYHRERAVASEPNPEEIVLAQRRQEYIRLFMRADVVVASPLTRAIQTALAAMHGHTSLMKKKLTLYSVIREIKRPGGLDTVGMEVGVDILRRVQTELDLTVGHAKTKQILSKNTAGVDDNDCNIPWWTAAASFESEREQRERLVEFLTYARYCRHKLPVFVGHSLFFKAFYSKRLSPVMEQERPNLCDNLKRFRLSNASLLAVTVKYFEPSQYQGRNISGTGSGLGGGVSGSNPNVASNSTIDPTQTNNNSNGSSNDSKSLKNKLKGSITGNSSSSSSSSSLTADRATRTTSVLLEQRISVSNNLREAGCSDCEIVDADLIFGGGFHGKEHYRDDSEVLHERNESLHGTPREVPPGLGLSDADTSTNK